MPQDPNLYGQRPVKKQKKEIPLSSSLAFTSQLTSLLSSEPSSSSAASGRTRPSRTKDDLFSSVKPKKRKATTTADNKDGGGGGGGAGRRDKDDEKDGGARLVLRDPRGTEDEKRDLARTRRRMEEKSRLYAAMKRGDYVAREGEAAPLVDFDAKWAARHPEGDGGGDGSSSGGTDDSEDDGDDDELIEYKDEFGRTRQGTRAQVARQRRREARAALGAEELEAMSARPRAPAPERLIRGDAVQTEAWRPDDDAADRMEALAARRDRTPTPPPDTHYDGAREIRTKGVGFYQFSADADARAGAMRNLAEEREQTERVRAARDTAREARRREIEERRRRIGERRSRKLADDFLDGLGAELAGADAAATAAAADAVDAGGAADAAAAADATAATTTTTTASAPAAPAAGRGGDEGKAGGEERSEEAGKEDGPKGEDPETASS